MKKNPKTLRCISICLTCLLLVSCLILPVNADSSMTSVAHPGVVFGEPSEITYNSRKDTVDYSYSIRRDPQNQLEELIEAMEEYGMTLEKNSKSFFGGDRTVELSFGEDLVTCFWDKSKKQLTVSCDVDLQTEWIRDSEEVYCWYEEEYPADYLKEQITIMQESYNLKYDGSEDLPDGGSSIVIGPNAEVRYDWYEQKHLFIATYQADWWEAGINQTANPTTPLKTEDDTSDTGTLPSFLEFDTGDQFSVSQADKHEGYYTVVYKAEDANAVTVAQDYIRMMRNTENCSVVAEQSKDRKDWYLEKVLLDHPCDVTPQRLEVLDDFYDYVGDLFLKINQYRDDDTVSFSITYVEGLTIADSDFTSNSGGGGGSLFGQDCSWCGGDGRCNECGGDGRVYNWLAGTNKYVDQNCTNCNMGKCRICGGSGKK